MKRRLLVAVIGAQKERRSVVSAECCMIIHSSEKKSVASVAYQSYVHARTATRDARFHFILDGFSLSIKFRSLQVLYKAK